jgi:hypothetical protein
MIEFRGNEGMDECFCCLEGYVFSYSCNVAEMVERMRY